MTPPHELPDDIDTLKRIIQDLSCGIQDLQRSILEERESRQAVIDRTVQTIVNETVQAAVDKAVQEAVAAILRRYYGPRSEKFDPRQQLLFGELMEQQPLDAKSIEQEAGERLVARRAARRDAHGRGTLPEHLERIEIEHDIQDKSCPACGCERCRIGAEVSEQLEYFPASFKVLKHIRHKYVCTKCEH